MGGGISKKINKETKEIHNKGFDLIDNNGDQLLHKNEIELIAEWFHKFMIIMSQKNHDCLKKKDPQRFLYETLNTMYGKPIQRKQFNKLALMIPNHKWQTELLPLLRTREIERLKNV